MLRKFVRYVVAPLALLLIGFVGILFAWLRVNDVPSLLLVPSVADWPSYAALGDRIGPTSARATAVVFSDYECPRSAELWGRLDHLRTQYPSELAVVYRHFPLEGPQSSSAAAARTAVCASREVGFERIHRELFGQAEQRSWVSWTILARRAGVADTVAFNECMRASASAERVERDLRAARRLEARGAPLLILNGARFNGAVDAKHLRELIEQIVQTREQTDR